MFDGTRYHQTNAILQIIQQSNDRVCHQSIAADMLYTTTATLQVIQQSDGRGCHQSITADVFI